MEALSPTGLYASGTSFTDVFNSTVGAEYQTVLASDGGLIDLSGALLQGDYWAQVIGTAVNGGGYLFSVAAVPAPAEWTLLLCGLSIVVFIARRRTGPAAA